MYYQNTTIPAGFGRFHRLDQTTPKSVAEFAASAEESRWVIPQEGCTQPYMYMRKVFEGKELVYILTVSVEAKAMNSFLFLPDQDGPTIQYQEDETQLVVNYSRYILDELFGRTLPGILGPQVVKTEASLEGFPQSILVITDVNAQKYWIYTVFFLVIVLVLVLMGNEIRFIQEIFARIQFCMKGFEASVEGGF